MSILVSATLLAASIGQVGTAPTEEDILGAHFAFIDFCRKFNTSFSGCDLPVSDIFGGFWDSNEPGTLVLHYLTPFLKVSARRVSNKWAVRDFRYQLLSSKMITVPSGRKVDAIGTDTFVIRDLPELRQVTEDTFGGLIRRHGIAFEKGGFMGKSSGIVYYTTPTPRWEKSKHASLIVNWRTTDAAIMWYRAWPVADPDL